MDWTCRDIRELLDLYVIDRRELSFDERQAIEEHLPGCSRCRREHESIGRVDRALRANRDYLIKEGLFNLDSLPPVDKDKADLLRLMAKMERAATRRRRRERGVLVQRAVAIAACLVVGFVSWWGLSRWATSFRPKPEPSLVLATGQRQGIRIEQSGPEGVSTLEVGQFITTQDGQIRALVLDGKHRLAMNVGTSLSIDPLPGDGKAGYLVNLRFGQIQAHVEPDGNPFDVRFAYGKAVITGTTFDIKATTECTTLVVAEGSVRFESEAGAVQVCAGQQSTICSASAAPTGPVACDAEALTAWARPPSGEDTRPAQEVQDTSALEQLAFDLPVPSPWQEIRTNLHDLELDKWASENRDWFARQFPWIFEFQDALAQTTNSEQRTTNTESRTTPPSTSGLKLWHRRPIPAHPGSTPVSCSTTGMPAHTWQTLGPLLPWRLVAG